MTNRGQTTNPRSHVEEQMQLPWTRETSPAISYLSEVSDSFGGRSQHTSAGEGMRWDPRMLPTGNFHAMLLIWP